MIKLDYTIQSPEERNKLVKKILEENPNPNEQFLEILSNYLILSMEKQERKKKKILTENRMTTINKRETSFEGLVSQFENGEDGVYNLIAENDKNVIFQPKKEITRQDLIDIPYLQEVKKAIEYWEKKLTQVQGREAYIVKQTIIELRKDQYVIKNAFKPPINLQHAPKNVHYIPLNCEEWVDADGTPQWQGVSLMSKQVCSAILCNYSDLKQNSYDVFRGDTWYLMHDFDKLADEALADFPVYERIVQDKIDGMANLAIKEDLQLTFGLKYSVEYISSLWRNKIPYIISEKAIDNFLDWYYLEVEYGKYKKCSRCGQIKLAHNRYFSKNSSSKDGFYSICKCCRNTKIKGGN